MGNSGLLAGDADSPAMNMEPASREPPCRFQSTGKHDHVYGSSDVVIGGDLFHGITDQLNVVAHQCIVEAIVHH